MVRLVGQHLHSYISSVYWEALKLFFLIHLRNICLFTAPFCPPINIWLFCATWVLTLSVGCLVLCRQLAVDFLESFLLLPDESGVWTKTAKLQAVSWEMLKCSTQLRTNHHDPVVPVSICLHSLNQSLDMAQTAVRPVYNLYCFIIHLLYSTVLVHPARAPQSEWDFRGVVWGSSNLVMELNNQLSFSPGSYIVLL